VHLPSRGVGLDGAVHAPRSQTHLAAARLVAERLLQGSSKTASPSHQPAASTPAPRSRASLRGAAAKRHPCSVLVVSHHLDGFLRVRPAGLLHPAHDHEVHRVSALAAARPGDVGVGSLLTDAGPSRAFPSRTADPTSPRAVPPRRSPAARWLDLEAFLRSRSPVRSGGVAASRPSVALLGFPSWSLAHRRLLARTRAAEATRAPGPKTVAGDLPAPLRPSRGRTAVTAGALHLAIPCRPAQRR
jgi:hypothetical protein